MAKYFWLVVYIYIYICVCVCVCVLLFVAIPISQNQARYISFFRSHFIYHHHHNNNNVVLVARISLTLSRHFSLSFIASGRSSGQHPVSAHSCWMYVRAGRPAFARPCVGVHQSISLRSSSLLLQQCPACLVRLTFYQLHFVYLSIYLSIYLTNPWTKK